MRWHSAMRPYQPWRKIGRSSEHQAVKRAMDIRRGSSRSPSPALRLRRRSSLQGISVPVIALRQVERKPVFVPGRAAFFGSHRCIGRISGLAASPWLSEAVGEDFLVHFEIAKPAAVCGNAGNRETV